jgi:hypothetical protein
MRIRAEAEEGDRAAVPAAEAGIIMAEAAVEELCFTMRFIWRRTT